MTEERNLTVVEDIREAMSIIKNIKFKKIVINIERRDINGKETI